METIARLNKEKYESTDDQKINEATVRETSQKYLGRIYDIHTLKMGEKPRALEENPVLVVEQKTFEGEKFVWSYAIDETIKRCNDKFCRISRFYRDRRGRFSKVHILGPHFTKVDTLELQADKGESIVCSAECLKIDRCQYQSLPHIQQGQTPQDYALSVIISGTCYIGYRYFIKLYTQHNVQNQGKTAKGKEREIASVQQIIDLGFDKTKLEEKLGKRTIIKVEIVAQSIGGYVIPKFDIAELNSVNKLFSDFQARYSSQERQFCIYPPDDLKYYADLVKKLEPEKHFIEGSNFNPTNKLEVFGTLAKGIMEGLSEEYKTTVKQQLMDPTTNRPISLLNMLLQIDLVFSSQFAHMPEKVDKSYCLVLGVTGSGKSTLIGYLLEYPLESRLISIGKAKKEVLDYAAGNEFQLGRDCPEIGHVGSETKGTLVYDNYIELGGLLDSSGVEARICSAIATQITINHYCPEKAILVISSADLDEGNMDGFFKIIEQLYATIPEIKHKETWLRMLLVVHDRGNIVQKETILEFIEDGMEQLKTERNQFIPGDDEYSKLRNMNAWSVESVAAEVHNQIRKLHEIGFFWEQIQEFQEKIEILETILCNSQNIVIADFTRVETRMEIKKWIEDGSKKEIFFQHTRPRKDNFNNRSVFKIAFELVKNYFRIIERQKEQNEKELAEIDVVIQALDLVIGSASIEGRVDCYKKLLTDSLEAQKKDYADQIEKLEKDIQKMKDDDAEVALEDLQPQEPIAPRLYWSIKDDNAKKYHFKVPIGKRPVRCEYIEGDPQHPGLFSAREDEFLKTGEVTYVPAWGNHKKNCNTSIRLFVNNKNHPTTKHEIFVKEMELSSRIQCQVETENCIHDLNEKIKSLEVAEIEVGQNKEFYEDKKQKIKEKKRTITVILDCTGNFKELLEKISDELNLLESNSKPVFDSKSQYYISLADDAEGGQAGWRLSSHRYYDNKRITNENSTCDIRNVSSTYAITHAPGAGSCHWKIERDDQGYYTISLVKDAEGGQAEWRLSSHRYYDNKRITNENSTCDIRNVSSTYAIAHAPGAGSCHWEIERDDQGYYTISLAKDAEGGQAGWRLSSHRYYDNKRITNENSTCDIRNVSSTYAIAHAPGPGSYHWKIEEAN